MTGLTVLCAAIEGHGRVRISPMLGYLSILLVLVVTCLGIWLLLRTATHWGSSDDDGGDVPAEAERVGEEARRLRAARSPTVSPTGGPSSSGHSRRT